MSTMKKFLAMAVVFVMVFGMMVPAFALGNDVIGTKYESAAAKLGVLGIMVGDAETGNFRPHDNIKRSEFAKIAVVSLGLEDAAKFATGATKFPDVVNGHWATGYINIAADQKIMVGDAEGTFRPDDTISYAEAVTVIVRALGYEPKAQAEGGYPSGYLAVAAEKGITKGINVVGNAGAKRGDVALMIDAALDTAMMVQTSWGNTPEYEEDESKTLLNSKLDVDEIIGRVVETAEIDGSTLEDNEIIINVTEKNGDDVSASKETYTALNEDMANALSLNLGLKVKAWVNGNDEIIFTDVETDDNDYYRDIVDADVANGDDQISLNIKDDDVDVDVDEVQVYINNQKADFEDLKAGMYGTFVEEKNEIVFINVSDWNSKYGNTQEVSGGSMVAVEANDEEIEYFNQDDDTSTLDLEEYEAVIVRDENGNKINTSDIEKYDVLYWWVNDDDEIFITVIKDQFEGAVTSANDEELYIDDDKYDIGADTTISDDNDDTIVPYTEEKGISLADDEAEVIATLDIYGDLRHITGASEATSGKMYGIMTDADVTTVTIVNENGEEVTYDLDSRSEGFAFNNYFESTATSGGNADAIYNYKQYIPVEFEINNDGKVEQLKYVVDAEGELADFFTAGDQAANANVLDGSVHTIDFNQDNYIEYNGAYYYVEKGDTVFMKYNSVDDDEPELVNWDNIKDTTSTSAKIAVVGQDGEEADFVVFYANYDDVAADDVYYGVVLNKPISNGNNYVVDVDVLDNDNIEDGKLALDQDSNKSIAVESTLIQFKVNTDGEIKDLTTTSDSVYKAYDATEMYVIDKNGKTLYLNADPSATSGTPYRIDSNAVVYTTEDDGDIDVKSDYSDIKKGDALVFLTDKDNNKMIKAALIVTEYVDAQNNAGGSDDNNASGDYTVINIDTTNEILAVRDADGNVKTFNIPSAGATFVEETDGTLTDIASSTELGVGDEIDITLTEGTTDVTYITVVVNN